MPKAAVSIDEAGRLLQLDETDPTCGRLLETVLLDRHERLARDGGRLADVVGFASSEGEEPRTVPPQVLDPVADRLADAVLAERVDATFGEVFRAGRVVVPFEIRVPIVGLLAILFEEFGVALVLLPAADLLVSVLNLGSDDLIAPDDIVVLRVGDEFLVGDPDVFVLIGGWFDALDFVCSDLVGDRRMEADIEVIVLAETADCEGRTPNDTKVTIRQVINFPQLVDFLFNLSW